MARSEAKPPANPPNAKRLEDVIRRLEAEDRPFDREWLMSVGEYAKRQHAGQKRRSGEPYFMHPLQVAWLLADLGFDPTCVGVGLLHDVLEDTPATFDDLKERFGQEVAELVEGVSKIGKHEYVRRDQAQAETFRKLVLASARDIRVILVKLADRLHNMQTLEHMELEGRQRIARETLEIYAPLAHRLGMSKVRGELEDLAFFHLHPEQFADLERRLKERTKIRRGATQRIRARLEKELAAAGIKAEISFRQKHLYSIHRKLKERGLDLARVYDYLAFRIVTESVQDTYAALGVVHQAWKPLPGRFKDYIAVPKPNMYQSLHTSVVNREDQPFEVQIRTREMDRVAEEGIAAHWAYKEGRVTAAASDSNILWLRRLLQWQRNSKEPRTFLSDLKIELYSDEVYVFTPKGDVQSLPKGAMPLDLAYRVHTELGHRCTGALVNGKLVSLRTELENGDLVEIQTSPNRNPSRDWLGMVATSRARSKIRHWLNTQQKREAEEIGRKLLEQEARKYRLSLRRLLDEKGLLPYLASEGLSRVEDLYSRVGFGRTLPRKVIEKLTGTEDLLELPAKPAPGRFRSAVQRILPFDASSAVRVRGEGDLMATIARCCNPVPGEPIVGFVTRGRGVSVHSEDCTNVRNLLYHPEREIDVEWASDEKRLFPVRLLMHADDRQGLLAKVTETIARRESSIRDIQARRAEGGRATIEVVVEVENQRQLDGICESLQGLAGILDVSRRRGTRREVAGESVPQGVSRLQ